VSCLSTACIRHNFLLQLRAFFFPLHAAFFMAKSSFPLQVACLAFSLHESGIVFTTSCKLFFPPHAVFFHRKIEFPHYKLRVLPFLCMHQAQFSTTVASFCFSYYTQRFSIAKSSFPLQVACLAFSLHELGTIFHYKLLAVFPTTRTVFPS
jgi:hypothetical protein